MEGAKNTVYVVLEITIEKCIVFAHNVLMVDPARHQESF
jgi:hypothetical protein